MINKVLELFFIEKAFLFTQCFSAVCVQHQSIKRLFPSSLWVQTEQSLRFSLLPRLNFEWMFFLLLWYPPWSLQWRSWLCWPLLASSPPAPGSGTAAGTEVSPAALWSRGLAGRQPCSTEPLSAGPENLAHKSGKYLNFITINTSFKPTNKVFIICNSKIFVCAALICSISNKIRPGVTRGPEGVKFLLNDKKEGGYVILLYFNLCVLKLCCITHSSKAVICHSIIFYSFLICWVRLKALKSPKCPEAILPI